MFDQGHLVGYNNCKSLIRILYPNIDLHRLPPSGIDVGKFIMALGANPSPSRKRRINASHRGASLPLGDPLESLEVAKDPSSAMMGPMDPKNNEGSHQKWALGAMAMIDCCLK